MKAVLKTLLSAWASATLALAQVPGMPRTTATRSALVDPEPEWAQPLGFKVNLPSKVQWTRTDLEVNELPLFQAGRYWVITKTSELHCIDPATGATRWKVALDPGFHTLDFTWPGRVLVSSGSAFLVCLELESGQRHWKADFRSLESFNLSGLESLPMSRPLVTEDRIYLGTYGSVGMWMGGYLYALDKATGKVLWETELKHGVQFRPFLRGGKVVAGGGARIFEVEPTTGKIFRELDVKPGIHGNPVPVGDQLFFVSSSSLVRADLLERNMVVAGGDWSTVRPLHLRGDLIIGVETGYMTSSLRVFSITQWKEVFREKRISHAPLLVKEGVAGIFEGGDAFKLFALPGTILWREKLSGDSEDQPRLAEGSVLLRIEDKDHKAGVILSLNLAEKAVAWRFPLGEGELEGPPAYSPEGILVWKKKAGLIFYK